MGHARYLTIQDMIWIHLQLTDKVYPYEFLKLEEATFYQYGYGTSTEPADRAPSLFHGFMKNKPFEKHNEVVGFIAFVAFLELNGLRFTSEDAACARWSGPPAEEKLKGSIEAGEPCHEGVKERVQEIITRYPKTIAKMIARGNEAEPSAFVSIA